MKVGDLVKCGKDTAIVLKLWKQPDTDTFWLECLWNNGLTDACESDDVELINESR